MSLTIALPPEDEKKLSERASAVGKDVIEYVEQLIRREISTPISIIEAAEPIANAVAAAGVTDEEFYEILTRARAEVRAERKKS